MKDHDQDESTKAVPDATTEAVAVFYDAHRFQDAIDGLLMNGFTLESLSVLANERTIEEKLGRSYKSTTELEDSPDAPRSEYVEEESIGELQGGIIAAATYLPAVIGVVVVTASGGTILGAIAAAAIAGGAGAGVGAFLASRIGKEHAKHLEEHIKHGGLLLWVRTPDREHEVMATDVLTRHGGQHVHLHKLPPLRRIASIPVRRPFLSFGRPV
jgi:hypothetical protein